MVGAKLHSATPTEIKKGPFYPADLGPVTYWNGFTYLTQSGESKSIKIHKLNGSTHRCSVTRSWGGVGRNVAECLHRLGAEPLLLTAVDSTTNLGQPTFECRSPTVPNGMNASYTAVLDANGECLLGLGDMALHDAITPQWIMENIDAFEEAPLIVMDGNISEDAMKCVMDLARKLDKPIFFEPTDIRKAARPFLDKDAMDARTIKFAAPNLNELFAMASAVGFVGSDAVSAGLRICEFVDNLFVTMGKDGILSIRRGDVAGPFFTIAGRSARYVEPASTATSCRSYPATEDLRIANVSGAGDCFAAGLIRAMLAGAKEEGCVATGFAAAEAALRSERTVPETIEIHEIVRETRPYQSIPIVK